MRTKLIYSPLWGIFSPADLQHLLREALPQLPKKQSCFKPSNGLPPHFEVFTLRPYHCLLSCPASRAPSPACWLSVYSGNRPSSRSGKAPCTSSSFWGLFPHKYALSWSLFHVLPTGPCRGRPPLTAIWKSHLPILCAPVLPSSLDYSITNIL